MQVWYSVFPDGVIGIFHLHNPSNRTMALRLTQLLTEMSIRNVSWGVKTAGPWGWQPHPLHVLIVLKCGGLNLLKPSGPVQACNWIVLPLPLHLVEWYRGPCTLFWYGWFSCYQSRCAFFRCSYKVTGMSYVKVDTLSSTWSYVGYFGGILVYRSQMCYLLKTRSAVYEANRS